MDLQNEIESTIDFTYERETNNTFILDILLINNNKLEYKYHHKSINKNNHRF